MSHYREKALLLKHKAKSRSVVGANLEDTCRRGVRKKSPRKKPPVRVRGRVKVRLGIGLGLESGGLFFGGVFSLNRWRNVKFDRPLYSKQTNLKGIYSWNKMWSLKSLALLKCEGRTSLHAAQYKWQPVSVLFCS